MMSSLQSLLPIWAPVQSVRGGNVNTSFHRQAYLVRRRGRTDALNFEDISGLDGSHGWDVRASMGERFIQLPFGNRLQVKTHCQRLWIPCGVWKTGVQNHRAHMLKATAYEPSADPQG